MRFVWDEEPTAKRAPTAMPPGFANVDLQCAVKVSAVLAHSRRLPICGDVDSTAPYKPDRAGRKRTRATLPATRRGVAPGNKGLTMPTQPLTQEEFLAIHGAASKSAAPAMVRFSALIVVLYRTGLRISEGLDLHASDLNREDHTVTVRCGKGSKRRLVGMDDWGFAQLEDWLTLRARYPDGPLFCVVAGSTRGGRMSSPWVRTKLKELAGRCGIEKNVRPHQLRHSLACDLAREGVVLPLISKQLGHSNVATTSTYLSGINPVEVTQAMCARTPPAPTPTLDAEMVLQAPAATPQDVYDETVRGRGAPIGPTDAWELWFSGDVPAAPANSIQPGEEA